MLAPHPNASANFFVQAAGIPSPWRATQCTVDEITRIVHIWITRHPEQQTPRRRSWFGLSQAARSDAPAPVFGPEQNWRHTNCMDYLCMIHTVDQLDTRHHELPWLGQAGLPFTNRMARQVFLCMMEGMEMSAICDLMNVPFTELWKFKFCLDNGQVKFDYVPAKKSRSPNAPNCVTETAGPQQIFPAQAARGEGAVPEVDSPVWSHLLTGELNIQIKTLSFQLILSKLRQQVSLQQSDEIKLMKLRELHRYVERNERSLSHELTQIRARSRGERA